MCCNLPEVLERNSLGEGRMTVMELLTTNAKRRED